MKPWRTAQVFTTCGSAAKRAYLQQAFPWLDDAHIGDSRSTSFEATVLGQVRGGRQPHLLILKSSQSHMCPLGASFFCCRACSECVLYPAMGSTDEQQPQRPQGS
jgi:hypothetical protein